MRSLSNVKNDDVTSSSQFSSWGSEVVREQLVGVTCVELSWHEFVLVESTAELECRSNVTCFASTMPLLTSSLPGQAQDMPPWCLHMSTLLCRLLAGNSAGINSDERTHENTENIDWKHLMLILLTLLQKHHYVNSTDLNSSRSTCHEFIPYVSYVMPSAIG